MSNESRSTLELKLLAELEDISQKLYELHQEKMAIERLLLKVSRISPIKKDVTRKNSITRILVETMIENKIASYDGKPCPISVISDHLKSAGYDINKNTFRSYIIRMKQKGKIMRFLNGYVIDRSNKK